MALKPTSVSIFLLLTIFLAMAGESLTARARPTKPTKEEDKKQPECLIEPDGSVIIPGVGRVLVPTPGGGGGIGPISANIPRYGSAWVGFDRRYIPGGDDTLVPNPGYEVPIPVNP